MIVIDDNFIGSHRKIKGGLNRCARFIYGVIPFKINEIMRIVNEVYLTRVKYIFYKFVLTKII